MGRKKKNLPLIRADTKEESITRMFKDISIRALEGEENERKFEISFSSEEPYERWYGTEILEHTEEAVDLSRIKEIGCVLFNHNRDKVVGKVVDAWLENGRCKAIIEFDTDAESDVIYEKVKSGTLKGVSVGYKVSVWEEVEAKAKSSDGRFEGPCSIAKKWMPFEISIVSVPADQTVGVGRVMEEKRGCNLETYERQIKINRNFI